MRRQCWEKIEEEKNKVVVLGTTTGDGGNLGTQKMGVIP
jgi:hypothetical protein